MPPTSRRPELAESRGRRIGIYGGTFDPIHIGHLIIASEMQAALDLDQVIFVPAGRPPHKDPAQVTSALDRLAMLRLAVGDNPSFTVDTLEINREGQSFTADTLATFKEREPGGDLWFIIGGDSLADLHTWRRPGTIVSLARLAVARRPGWGFDLDRVNHLLPETTGRIDVVDTPLIDIASHEIRFRASLSQPIRYLIPETVRDYIDQNRLYSR